MLSAQHPDRERGEERTRVHGSRTQSVGQGGSSGSNHDALGKTGVDTCEDASRQLWEEQQLWSSCAGSRIPTTSNVPHMLRFDSTEVTRPLWAPRPSTGMGGETSNSTPTHVTTRNAPPSPFPCVGSKI